MVVYKYGSTLAQVMACCLTAPNNLLNQTGLIFGEVWWYSPKCNSTGNAHDIYHWYEVKHNMTNLTHWGRVTHICVGKLIIIGSDNGLSPDRRQAILWTNARLLSMGPLRTYFNENLIKIQQFSLKKMHVKMSSAKWRPSGLGLNVLRYNGITLGSVT